MLTGDLPTATALIEVGVEVNPRDTEHGETGLILAAQVGSEPLVRLLLQRGADVNARICGPNALLRRDEKVAAEILKLPLDWPGWVDDVETP